SALTIDGSGAIVISGSIDGSGSITKLGENTLTLSNANTYLGVTDIRQGVLVVAHDEALGAATAETQVQAGASIHLTGGRTVTESLSIREGGIGFGSATDPSELGALRSISGTNIWAGNIEISASNNVIGVNLGSTLNLSGVVAAASGNANNIYKVGEGTLQLTGTQSNTYRGTTRVLQGTLELGKTAGLNAVGGSVVIGDDLEATGTKTLRLLANDQLPHLDVLG
ncbi:MAG: autotransporter-associated beta strand repeat-containing protein, partial [Verrucomicrobiae bacterium]|nr:autotransporter-associated beta strand repeat-containing protein [Verrucomicrobiae bacterium]